MYQVIEKSYRALTSVAFFVLSYVAPYTSHIALTVNQNWSRSSFHTPLNIRNFIMLAILNYGGGGGCVGEDKSEDSEIGSGVGGSGVQGIRCFIKLMTLIGKTFAISSLLSRRGEIKGIVSSFVLLSFL